ATKTIGWASTPRISTRTLCASPSANSHTKQLRQNTQLQLNFRSQFLSALAKYRDTQPILMRCFLQICSAQNTSSMFQILTTCTLPIQKKIRVRHPYQNLRGANTWRFFQKNGRRGFLPPLI